MRHLLASAILGAAFMATPPVPSFAAPATQPADAQQPVPVREVVLFSSGVGYFEHFGTVNGDAGTQLRFKTDQINDILKSLVLQDLDGGKVAAVTYPSQGPLAHTLKSFQVDITSNPPLAELLNQLRGAEVSVTLAQGARDVSGTVLGVEKQQRPSGDKDRPQLIDTWVLNLVSEDGIRPVELAQVSDVKIKDPELRKELAAALSALSQARDKDKKPVDIRFTGQGDRRVRIGYVVETPVWKTSYRLILSGAHNDDAKPEDKDKNQQKQQGGSLQGWAIVENQTDNDWKDVQLSLVSGRPISFIQDLYQPLYVPRPVVQPELFASLKPQTYDAGLSLAKEAEKMELEEQVSEAKMGVQRQMMRRRDVAASAAPAAGGAGGAAFANRSLGAIDATASVSSIASAAKVGELFQYTVGSVTLPRQKSAMLPIVTDAIDVSKLSIYNASVMPKNPLLGARLKNSTGKFLLQGPVTVLDGGSYAGDARIEDLPPGQQRLISYGVDQQVIVNSTANRQESRLQTGKIIKGVLELTVKQAFTQDYVSENKGDAAKTLLIEHPLHQGWKLVEPAKAQETTETLYRFEGKLPPHQPTKLTVKEEVVTAQQVAILPMDLPAIQSYIRTGEIPQSVRDALAKAAQKKRSLVETQRQLQENQQHVNEISQEQNRIRENMKTVSQSSDYYKRLLKKLDEQETSVEKLQQQATDLQQTQEKQRKDLEDYLSDLNVG